MVCKSDALHVNALLAVDSLHFRLKAYLPHISVVGETLNSTIDLTAQEKCSSSALLKFVGRKWWGAKSILKTKPIPFCAV